MTMRRRGYRVRRRREPFRTNGRCGSLRRPDLDSLGGGVLRLLEANLEDAIPERRAGLVSIDAGRKRQRARETARPPLGAVVVFVLRLALLRAFTSHRERPVVH